MKNLIEIVDQQNLDFNRYGRLKLGVPLGEQLDTEISPFEIPRVVTIDGKVMMRDQWSKHRLKEKEIVTTVPVVGGVDPITIVAIAVSLLSVATVLLAPSPSVPSVGNISSTPEAAPVFSIAGQQNKTKLGQSIEVGFGKFRHWPSNAASPWNSFDGSNDEILHALLCVGEGTYTEDEIKIEDTPIGNFSGASYVMYPPGTPVTAFAPNVETAAEVNQVQLFAPNEPENEDWGTAYVVGSVGSTTTKIQFDIQTPRGLYKQGTPLTSLTIDYEARYHEIDDNGDDVGGWSAPILYSITGSATTVIRKSHDITGLSSGRYKFQARRTDTKDTLTDAAHQIDLVRVKSFNTGGDVFTNQTVLAVTLKATNRINNNTQNRINGRFQRLLDVYNETTKVFDPLQITNSPVDAIISLLREPQHGNVDDINILLDELAVMRTEVANDGIVFNWLMESDASVREAANTVAKVFNGKIIVDGTDFTIWRDVLQTESKAMYQPNNMVAKTFSQEVSMENAGDSYDGVEIEYTNYRDWLPRTVLCTLADESGLNPERIRLEGVTDETHAFRLGMRRRSGQRYERDNIKFATDIEGFLPNFGNRILVGHDVPKWSQFGRVVSIDTDTKTIVVQNPPEFEIAETHNMMIKTRLGGVYGPFEVTDNAEYGSIDYSTEESFDDIVFDPAFELPTFQIGSVTKPFLTAKIIFLKSQKGGEQVAITSTNYDERVYDFDAAFPP
ncbi:MAG: hypothetical protein CMI54_05670 [Parcubacteria group bacterium]|jgi:hypothetical protein|nr:hypothetical protein [Parcubacteria group bacterium]|tara:strand:- start:13451 stop:15631 length:2181 start_codon:yes stop_codon:yes gene_type:complete